MLAVILADKQKKYWFTLKGGGSELLLFLILLLFLYQEIFVPLSLSVQDVYFIYMLI